MAMINRESRFTPSEKGRLARSWGFSIYEFLVILAVSMALVAAGLPAFVQWTKRAQILGFVRATQTRLQVARTEAVRGQFPVVVQPDLTNEQILVFANVDNDPSYSFDPDPTQVHRTADYEIARLNVPVERRIYLWHPEDGAPNGVKAIEDLTLTPTGDKVVVFLPNGSVVDTGGIHVGDSRGNYFSIRVEPEATAKVRILKWDSAPPWGTPWDDGDYFFPRGRHPTENVPMWRWF